MLNIRRLGIQSLPDLVLFGHMLHNDAFHDELVADYTAMEAPDNSSKLSYIYLHTFRHLVAAAVTSHLKSHGFGVFIQFARLL